MTVCPECSEKNRDRAMFCTNCGEMLIPDQDIGALMSGVPTSPAPAAAPSRPPQGAVTSAPAISAAPPVMVAEGVAPFPDDAEPLPAAEVGPAAPFPTIPPTPGSEMVPPMGEIDAAIPFPDVDDDEAVAPKDGLSSEAEMAEGRGGVPFPEFSEDDDVPSPEIGPGGGEAPAVAPFPDELEEASEPPEPAAPAPVEPETHPEPAASAPVEPEAPRERGGARVSAPSAKPAAPSHESAPPTKAVAPITPTPTVSVIPPAASAKPVASAARSVAPAPVESASPPAPKPAGPVMPDLDQIAAGGPETPETDDDQPFASDFASQPPVMRSVITTIPAPVEWQSKGCSLCGFQNEPEAAYCGECGTALSAPSSPSGKNTVIRLLQLGFDGDQVAQHSIDSDGLMIHSITGDIDFLGEYNVKSHAMFRKIGADLVLIPPTGEGGVFARIPPNKPVPLPSPSTIKIGHQLLEFEKAPPGAAFWGILRNIESSAFPEAISLDKPEIIVGRAVGQIRFSDDPLISGTHMKLTRRDGDCFIFDMESTNGTFLQIPEKRNLTPGQVFTIGAKIYKISVD